MHKRPSKLNLRPEPELCPACLRALIAHVQAAAKGSSWLTATGVRSVHRLLRAGSRTATVRPFSTGTLPLPSWDRVSGRLEFGHQLLHKFEKKAPAQAAFLNAFQAAGWTAEPIPNPLPREPRESDEDYEGRTVETVKSLNRSLAKKVIHFALSWDRKSVRWEYAQGEKPRRKRGR